MSQKDGGFSLIELLIVVAIILIIAAIAIPSLLRSKLSANEASAVHSLRTLNTACANYASTYGTGYPAALSNLGPAVVSSAAAADLIDSTLASGSRVATPSSTPQARQVQGVWSTPTPSLQIPPAAATPASVGSSPTKVL